MAQRVYSPDMVENYDDQEWWMEPAPVVAPSASGPPYTASNPPPAGSAPPGTQWMLNPGTGEFEPIPIGTMPPWGAIANPPTSPPPTVAPAPAPVQTYDNYATSYGGGDMFAGLQAPERTPLSGLNYPALNLPRMTAPPPFAYPDYKPLSVQDAMNEPGFDYALKQGIKAYENSKAFTGTYKGGATIKGINDYARNMAMQNYGQADERNFRNYSANRSNAADSYMTNYGVSRDVFDRNTAATSAEFAPRARGTELQFARDWDLFAYEGDDAYRRWKALIDANTP